MSYRLDLGIAVPDAVRAVALERFDHALEALREEDVHGARKDLKKLRSLLRLCRTGMPKAARQDTNTALRHIAQGLSGAREAEVMAATARSLGASFEAPPATTVIDPGSAVALAGQRAAVSAWPVEDLDRRALATGIAITYARGREHFRSGDTSVDGLHEWRKRVKDLWYQSRLLSDATPALAATIQDANALGELLGDDHDYGVLAWHVEDIDLITRCHRRRAELQDVALAVGARLYVERPKAFARRISAALVNIS